MSLNKIEAKVLSGKRLTSDDALTLFQNDDIFTIGRLASYIARKKNKNKVYFIRNHHINPTNICVNRCKFCAFSRSKGEKGAYELTIKEIIKKLRAQESGDKRITGRLTSHALRLTPLTSHGLSEVHIVGGLHPDWTFDFYLEMLRDVKKNFPDIHIKAFTAVEIDYFSKISGLSLASVLAALKNAGLGSMPGGGAEIFNSDVRNKICPEKITGRRWLEIMEKAHSAGIKSNATMLYGHRETYRHRVEHMLKLRELQDKTGGFQAFIPLAFHPMNTELAVGDSGLGISNRMTSNPQTPKPQSLSFQTPNPSRFTSGIDDIKTIAVSRIFLDNFPHIKAYWIMLGEKIAQLALLFGADDLDGTVIEERITHSAGALSGSAMTKDELINLIQKADKQPVERDSFYRPGASA
ncbi:MAG: CofH family radical SAM protein [Nitrospirae bacterium]|nr:CofH family radical SAM protein [Nitrospirota bacterium]